MIVEKGLTKILPTHITKEPFNSCVSSSCEIKGISFSLNPSFRRYFNRCVNFFMIVFRMTLYGALNFTYRQILLIVKSYT